MNERTVLDLPGLHGRRHQALSHWDVGGAQAKMAKLRDRIRKGREKARDADPRNKAAAELKLAGLEDELKALETEHDIPAEAYDWLYSVAESLTKRDLPPGSVATIRIPGILDVSVALDEANEPPF